MRSTVAPSISFENVDLDAQALAGARSRQKHERRRERWHRQQPPPTASAGTEQVAGAHPRDALLGGVDAETIRIHVHDVESPAPAGAGTDPARGEGGVGGQLLNQVIDPLPSRLLLQPASEHLAHHGAEDGAVAQSFGEPGPPRALVRALQLIRGQ